MPAVKASLSESAPSPKREGGSKNNISDFGLASRIRPEAAESGCVAAKSGCTDAFVQIRALRGPARLWLFRTSGQNVRHPCLSPPTAGPTCARGRMAGGRPRNLLALRRRPVVKRLLTDSATWRMRAIPLRAAGGGEACASCQVLLGRRRNAQIIDRLPRRRRRFTERSDHWDATTASRVICGSSAACPPQSEMRRSPGRLRPQDMHTQSAMS